MSTRSSTIVRPGDAGQVENLRRSRRQTLVAPASIWRGSSPDGTPLARVSVTNISLGGLALRARLQLEVGEVYYLRLIAGPLHLESPVLIAWSRRRDDNVHDIGAEFIGRP